MEKLSIVIPIYKVPYNLLRKCIDSIIEQTYKNLEIILVDDGSPDDCGVICDEYKNLDNRIIVINQKNGGLSNARNVGFINSTGKYLMFVDGDDWIDRNCCEVVMKEMIEQKCDFLMFRIQKHYANKQYAMENKYMRKNGIYTAEDRQTLLENIYSIESNITSAYAKVFDISFLRNNKIMHNEDFPQGAEDIIFSLYLILNYNKAYFLDSVLYHYIYNNNSISSSYNENNHLLTIGAMTYMEKYLCDNNMLSSISEIFYTRVNNVLITVAISGYFNPENELSFKERKRGFDKFLKTPILSKSINTRFNSTFSRKLILLLIKNKMYFLINIFAKIRYIYKTR